MTASVTGILSEMNSTTSGEGTARRRVNGPVGATPSGTTSAKRTATPPRPRGGMVGTATNPVLPALPPLQLALRRSPYAYHPATPLTHLDWRMAIARRWVQWHIAGALAALVGAIVVVLAGGESLAGFWLGSFAIAAIALCAAGFRALEYQSPGAAAILVLVCDVFAVIVGLALLGPRAEILALLPGALLVAILLLDPVVVLVTGCACFAIYLYEFFQGVPPQILLDGRTTLAAQLGLLLAGGILLLAALALAASQLRRALAGEAAMEHALWAAERRTAYKRACLDADALALQTALTHTMRGGTPAPVATGEDLAPLATMINAIAQRIPSLLRDREERLKVERAVRQVNDALEHAWAGLNWTWPERSGTSVDQLVVLLQPAVTEREAS